MRKTLECFVALQCVIFPKTVHVRVKTKSASSSKRVPQSELLKAMFHVDKKVKGGFF
jgi:hypothetical protein